MSRINTLFLSVLMFHCVADSAVLNFEPATSKIEGIVIAKGLQVKEDPLAVSLLPVGQGVRKKKVAFMRVNVYLLEIFAADVSKVDNALGFESLASQGAMALKLTFLRNIESTKITEAYDGSLKANNLTAEEPLIKEFMAEVKATGDVKENDTYVVVGSRGPTEDSAFIQISGRPVKTVKGPSGSVKKLFSIWLGAAVDDELKDMQKNIFK